MTTFNNSTYEVKIYLNGSLLWSDTLDTPTQANIDITNNTGQFLLYPNSNMASTVNSTPFNTMYNGTIYGQCNLFAIYDVELTESDWNSVFN